MSVKTSNIFGDITIKNDAIAVVAGYNALDCYGVVDLISNNSYKCFNDLFKCKPLSRGVKITSVGNHIIAELSVVLKYGVSIKAVAESCKSSIKYGVEKFTGMIVDAVNINVVGFRV